MAAPGAHSPRNLLALGVLAVLVSAWQSSGTFVRPCVDRPSQHSRRDGGGTAGETPALQVPGQRHAPSLQPHGAPKKGFLNGQGLLRSSNKVCGLQSPASFRTMRAKFIISDLFCNSLPHIEKQLKNSPGSSLAARQQTPSRGGAWP